MADESTVQNPLDTWRQFITDSERQWNGFFKEVLGSDTASGAMATFMEAQLTVQRLVADNLERYYTTFNIPTHNDLVALAERMKAIEDTLSRLEVAMSRKMPVAAKPVAPRRKPARTRRPAASAAARSAPARSAANGSSGA